MAAVWWTELRGLLAVGLVAGGIAFAWTQIEARTVDDVATVTTTTTTSTTTTVVTTTTQSVDERNAVICERARSFADEAELVEPGAGPGPVARLALDFWTEIERLTDGGVRAEVSAVVTYYEDYLRIAEPFDFDTAQIIVNGVLNGNKEKLQQLITRPAPGLADSRALISLCGVTVPDQPTMRLSDFDELEDRLLDVDPDHEHP
jgi:hypothetical protein